MDQITNNTESNIPCSAGLPRFNAKAEPGATAVWAISIAVFMAALDVALVHTALPTIASVLGASGSDVIWAVMSYQLVMVAAMLPLASLGEIWGHRKVFTMGLAIFTVSSLACGLAWSLATLVVARALQGLGAAAIMGVNIALIRNIYPEMHLGRGIGINALVNAIGIAAGPSVASVVLSMASWQWLFLLNVPAGVVALVMAYRAIPETHRAARPFDTLGALLCFAMFALAVHGLGGVAHRASWLLVGGEFLGAAVCAVSLIHRQRGQPAAMLGVDLFRIPAFSLSTLAAICAFATHGLTFASLPFLLQHMFGRTQVETGFLMTPWPLLGAVLAPIAGRLSDRYPAGLLGGIGLCLLGSGIGVLSLLPAGTPDWVIAGCMAVCGCGFGLFLSPNQKVLMSSAPAERSGGASGILGVARLLGQTTGAASVALFLTVSISRGPVFALWLGCIFAVCGAGLSALRLLPSAKTS
ncbi:MFS transporter [Cupriavidus consociatus]|uniref:MFS transporter n=1 Tax=Cupriavidus consociatus TaxID=2821357 RepID=UPI001AE3761A|nr:MULTISPECIES: MFS transporter [unclassified Cupriavidus]MBP0625324.1 MFS transporter [Cupriavidus sp. LEh25]MDK2662060.1 MFS transporter [Cupriavidus sp. LEh21]